MTLFKSTDEKLRDLGFIKTEQSGHGAFYVRHEPEGYIHVVALARKQSGRHIIQSYDKDLFDVNCTGNVCVGLTYREARLFLRKMREIGLHLEEKT